MCEFLAEAQVLIRPDTTKFRAELLTAISVATKGITAPIQVVPVAAGASAAALAASTAGATVAIKDQTAALQVQGAQATLAATKTKSFVQTQGALRKGVIASAAGLAGLRGAVLAASAPFLLAT